MSNLFAFWSISESPANGTYVLNPAVTHTIAYNMRINTDRTIALDTQGGAISTQLSEAWLKGIVNGTHDAGKKCIISFFTSTNIMTQTQLNALFSSQANREQLADNIIDAVELYDGDGINLDIEYPQLWGDTSGLTEAQLEENFTGFLNYLYTTAKSSHPDWHISMCVGWYITAIPAVIAYNNVQYLDGIIYMAYDYHASPYLYSAPNSPLFNPGYPNAWDYGTGDPVSPLPEACTSVAGGLDFILDYFPASKIILTLPLFAYDTITTAHGSISDDEKGANQPSFDNHVDGIGILEAWEALGTYPVQRDYASVTPWYTYYDTIDDAQRQVWFDDIQSWNAKIAYARGLGITNLGVYCIGPDHDNMDKDIWECLGKAQVENKTDYMWADCLHNGINQMLVVPLSDACGNRVTAQVENQKIIIIISNGDENTLTTTLTYSENAKGHKLIIPASVLSSLQHDSGFQIIISGTNIKTMVVNGKFVYSTV